MTSEQMEQKEMEITDLAEKFVTKEMDSGEPFSEGLCNWAISKAEQEIGSVYYS